MNNQNNNEEHISNNQVMVMFESLNENIKFIASEVSDLKKDLNGFKEETNNNFQSFRTELDVFKKETRDNFKSLKNELNDFKKETGDSFKAIFEWQSSFSDNSEEEFASMKRELEEIKEELKKRPTGEDFYILKDRVGSLEYRFNKYEEVRVKV